MSAAAVILAGGDGVRFKGDRPKQLAMLHDEPVVGRTLQRFDLPAAFDLLVLVAQQGIATELEDLARGLVTSVDLRIVPAGDDRNGSICNAVDAIPFKDGKVLVHDGVRPLVPRTLIFDVLAGLEHNDAVLPVVPSADRIVEVVDGFVTGFPHRMARMQSPQGFWIAQLREAARHHRESGEPTWSTAFEMLLAWRRAARIAAVEGSLSNVKLTAPLDLQVLEALWESEAP